MSCSFIFRSEAILAWLSFALYGIPEQAVSSRVNIIVNDFVFM